MISRIQKKENTTNQSRRSNRNKRLRKFLLLSLGSLLVLWIVYSIITYSFKLKDLVVEGSTRYTAEEMKDYLLTHKTDQITFMMYLRQKFGDHVSIPFIESYSVTMEGRHTIKVKVYERMVIGCVKLLDSYMYFDRDGIVVESSKEKIEGVPLISGLKFDKILLHEKLEIQKESLFDMILNLTKTIYKFELKVDKVFINSDYEVTLYFGENEVLLGKRDFYDVQLAALPSVMESSNNMKLSYDLRYYDENNKKITAKPIE